MILILIETWIEPFGDVVDTSKQNEMLRGFKKSGENMQYLTAAKIKCPFF